MSSLSPWQSLLVCGYINLKDALQAKSIWNYICKRRTEFYPPCDYTTGTNRGLHKSCSPYASAVVMHSHRGLVLFAPGIEMEIVNSCEKHNGGCSHHCEHTTNGPSCSCNHGFHLDQDGKTCVGENLSLSIYFLYVILLFLTALCVVPPSDSDECATGEACCSHFCRNSPGGYDCSCRAGHILNPDGCGCDGRSPGMFKVYLVRCFLALWCRETPREQLLTDCSP